MEHALVFACSGFLAGVILHQPSRNLSKRLQCRGLGTVAWQEARSLLGSFTADDFMVRYWRTLALLVRWIGARSLLLSIQLGAMIACYCAMTGLVNWMNTAMVAWHLSEWTFSLCAVVGTGIKALYGPSAV